MSLLHHDTRISAVVKNNDYFGSLVWKGGSPRYMDLEAIPKHAEVHKGDSVVTSGYSSMFPEGLLIGTVASAKLENGSNFYNIRVKLSCDLNKIKHVYVVDNLMREEQETLEASVADE
jgi:rod shape-determining protein MreC